MGFGLEANQRSLVYPQTHGYGRLMSAGVLRTTSIYRPLEVTGFVCVHVRRFIKGEFSVCVGSGLQGLGKFLQVVLWLEQCNSYLNFI